MKPEPASEADRFLELLRPIERDLELYCRRLIWDPQETLAAIQNAVLRAFAAFDRYHADASFRAWLFKILTREVLTLNRKHARIALHEFQLEPHELEQLAWSEPPDKTTDITPAFAELGETLSEPLMSALKTLSDNERAVLLLRAIANLRYREIAETLEIPIGSVMAYLARARQKMRAAIARANMPNPRPKGGNL
ncbi:MAG: RNA polymerase sigma factor [Verrucomicrobia bacterium]|nr:RNA polymerase sigma factor [Verrucomicrobiota bacterium]